jgi:plastocyanin
MLPEYALLNGYTHFCTLSNDASAPSRLHRQEKRVLIRAAAMPSTLKMARTLSIPATALAMILISGLTVALPMANAQSTVTVSMPSGAVDPKGAPGYAPDTIMVVIGVNNTVVWTNNDSAHHTVTSVSGNGSISSGDMAAGATFNYTFTAPGTYNYVCVYHNWMTGTVVVEAASTSSSMTSSASSSSMTSSASSSSMASTSTSTGGGGGVPEFPYQLLAAAVFTLLLAASYLLIRRRTSIPSQLGTSRSVYQSQA